MASRPEPVEVSAIVTCFRRRDYVLKAIESVLGQQPKPTNSELIVVSDFTSELARLVRDSQRVPTGWELRFLDVTDGPIGASAAAGIESARGRVLCLLDDDDVWEPTRLKRVTDVFQKYPSVGFYKNQHSFIDDTGAGVPDSIARRRLHQFLPTLLPAERVVSAYDVLRSPRLISPYNPMFNSSSMALRSSILKPRFEALAALPALVDSFQFYSALCDRSDLFFDSERLTRYRLHRGDPSSRVNIYLREGWGRKTLDAIRMIEQIVTPTGNRLLAGLLRHDRAYYELREGVASQSASRASMARSLALGAKHLLDFERTRTLALTLLAMTYVVSPKLASSLFWGSLEIR